MLYIMLYICSTSITQHPQCTIKLRNMFAANYCVTGKAAKKEKGCVQVIALAAKPRKILWGKIDRN